MRILIVEDEALIAMMAEDMVEAVGASVVGIAASVPAALDLIAAGGFDAVMLDVNLAGINSRDIAEALKARSIPFLFTTGGSDGIDATHDDVPILAKPYTIADLERALAALN